MYLSFGAGRLHELDGLQPRAKKNLIGCYKGDIVLVVNALCYSAADIFAASFQDHELGKVLGVHGHTGAGGATVMGHLELKDVPS